MNEKVIGLRGFLLATLRVITCGKQVPCCDVEQYLYDGIATKLFELFTDIYTDCGLSEDRLASVDDYFRHKWYGVADGQEGKYCCELKDGLQLVVALALNEIP